MSSRVSTVRWLTVYGVAALVLIAAWAVIAGVFLGGWPFWALLVAGFAVGYLIVAPGATAFANRTVGRLS